MITVYISIGNSDDKLSQAQWAALAQEIQGRVSLDAAEVHGYWTSSSVSPWQNACICAEVPDGITEALKRELAVIAFRYDQDSIAWAEAPVTEFIGGEARKP